MVDVSLHLGDCLSRSNLNRSLVGSAFGGEEIGGDVLIPWVISNCAGEFQHPLVGSGSQLQLVHGGAH